MAGKEKGKVKRVEEKVQTQLDRFFLKVFVFDTNANVC